MEIFFDWELDEKIEQPIHKWVYEDLRKFIKSRFAPLEEEVDNNKQGEVAFVVFCWGDEGISTKCFDINQDLIKKLNECLTQEDMDYIMEKIGQKIDNKANEN